MGFLRGVPETLGMQAVRCAIAGVICLASDEAVHLLLGKVCDVPDQFATVGGRLIGIPLSYLFAIAWIFKSRTITKRAVEIQIFVLIGLSGLVLNYYGMGLLANRWHVDDDWAWMIMTVFTILWVFANKKFWLFSDRGGVPLRGDVAPTPSAAPSAPRPATAIHTR